MLRPRARRSTRRCSATTQLPSWRCVPLSTRRSAPWAAPWTSTPVPLLTWARPAADPRQAALQALLAEVEKRGSKVEQWQSQSTWPGRKPTQYAKFTNKEGKEGTLRVGDHASGRHSKDKGRVTDDWKPGQKIDDKRKFLDANKLYSAGRWRRHRPVAAEGAGQ